VRLTTDNSQHRRNGRESISSLRRREFRVRVRRKLTLRSVASVQGVPENPDTLDSCYYFASDLTHRGKIQEAKEFARRAAAGGRKVLGSDHPSTRKYEKLLADLEAKH
jgi:hypothetical protein